jgi:predicted outer membrane repeat protein
MRLLSWLHRRTTGRPHTRTSARKPAARFRPQLEALEDRCVPSSTTLRVTNLLDSGPGSLRYEIAQAKSNDTIVFANKLDGGTITLTSGELLIAKNLTIQGPGAGLLTVTTTGAIQSASYGPSRIFEVYDTVALSGMTISNGVGYASPNGYNVDPDDGTGGGVLNHGTLTISGCILSGNRTYTGGAIANLGMLTVSGCTLSNNIGSQAGGGISNEGTLTVSGCTLSGNSSVYGGGGIFNNGRTLTVSGCTLTGNTAFDWGGAIYSDGSATVMGCTLIGNTANYDGGGIYNAGTLTVSNSVFSGNSPDNIFGPYTDGGGNTFK